MLHFILNNVFFSSLMTGFTGRKITYLLLLLFLGGGFVVQSEAQSVKFEHITMKDGLSQSVVEDITQDDKGYMWFATQDGLDRYDGINFRYFKHIPDDSLSVSNSFITTLHNVEGEPEIWVGTSSGLNLFDTETFSFKRYYHHKDDPTTLSQDRITDIYSDGNEVLWIGTYQGLNRYKKDSDTFQRQIPSKEIWNSKYRNITDIIEFSGDLWIGTEGGLIIFDREKQEFKRPGNKLGRDHRISTFGKSADGGLWVGTFTDGLYKIDQDHKISRRLSVQTGLLNNTINTVQEDDFGHLWVGSNEGIQMIIAESGKILSSVGGTVTDPTSLSTAQVFSFFIDRSNVVWIGTFEGSLNKTNILNENVLHYKHNPGDLTTISSSLIKTITEDNEGNIWIGTADQGMNKFDPKTRTFTRYKHEPGNPSTISGNYVKALYVDSQDNLWVVINGVGVDRFDMSTWEKTKFRPDPNDPATLPHTNVWVIKEGKEGYIWMGTYGGGLTRFDPQTERFKTYQYNPDDPASISSNNITEIFIDNSNIIWLGTENGINLLDPKTGQFEYFVHDRNDDHSLPEGPITSIMKTSSGKIWIATYGGGIARVNSDKMNFTSLRINDGLANNGTYAILEDSGGMLWISTNDGISRLNPVTMEFKNFTTSHGLQSKEFSYGAYENASDGTMYFGGINGFNAFKPEDINTSSNPPQVEITNFELFNKDVPIGETEDGRTLMTSNISYTSQIDLSHKDYVISFEFAALHYAYPAKNKYAYKLEGMEESWNYVDNRNFVSYTNVPPGEYTFKVKAANYDGVWNEEGTSLALTVAPPFWQTAWFYFVAGIFIAGCITGGYRLRVRSIREYNKWLEEEVADRTSDLEEALEKLRSTRDQLVEKAHKAGMADIAAGVLHNVGNVLNSVNTSASLIEDTLNKSKLQGFLKANTILRDHKDNLKHFIAEHPKGEKLLRYYLELEEPLKEEQEDIINQSQRLMDKIHLINEVIAAQQTYAGASMHADQTSLSEMIDNALALQAGSIERHGLAVKKDLQASDSIVAQRAKLIHILVNLFKNAKEAMAENVPKEKVIHIKTWQDEDWVYLSISDNGSGIREEHLDKVFTHGFTTKKSGHGFGLHSCANYMTEMGGRIEVNSKGRDKGAVFTLIFSKSMNSENDNKDGKRIGITNSNGTPKVLNP